MKNLIKKMFNYFNKMGTIRTDLLLHGGVSALLVVLLFNIIFLFKPSSVSLLLSIFITLVIGVFKEYVIDKKIRDSYVDVKDLYADAIGTFLGAITIIPLLFK